MKNLSTLSDEELTSRFRDSLIDERERLVDQLNQIAEMNRRKLFYHHPSLWKCLIQEFGMDGAIAQRRIDAAKMLARFPELESKLESGRLNLSLLGIAHDYFRRKKLSHEEQQEILAAFEGKSCLGAERELRRRDPSVVRIPKERMRVITEELFELNFVADEELLDQLEQVKGLLAHSHPGIKLAELVKVVTGDYLKRHHPEERAKRAEAREAKKTNVGQNSNESVRSLVISQVNVRTPSRPMTWSLVRRDGYSCSYIDSVTGKRCGSHYGLERDHRIPWAKGGKTELSNLRFLCRAHNLRSAIVEFGVDKVRSGCNRIR